MSNRAKSIVGKQFSQENLDTDLKNAIAGHQKTAHVLLSCFSILLGLCSSIVIGFLGAFLALDILTQFRGFSIEKSLDAENPIYMEGFLTSLVVITGMITVSTQQLLRSIVITVTLAILVVTGTFLILQNQSRLPPDFLLTVIVGILFSLLASYLSFFVIRFADALADIVLTNPRAIKAAALFVMIPSALIGAQAAISSLQTDGMVIEQILSILPAAQVNQTKSFAMALGIVSTLAMVLGARFANRRRNVPWNYPDILRSLALTVASWCSTSFYNLDLSNVSFHNAKLANADLRGRKLYRTNFRGVTGLKRARVNNRYLDLALPKVQTLLTHGFSENSDYNRLNLQGAFLQGSDLRRLQFIDTNLTGADLRDADLRGAILARTQAIDTDFTNANLTGICIKDWSVNEQTLFTNVLCDYVYRELDEKGEPVDRYPADRNFEPQEFESLYQELGNVAELVFKEGINWRAFSFSMQKLDLEDDGLGLELKGFERRGDRWVVRVTHNQHVPKQEVESRLLDMYDDMKGLLAAKEDQIHQLLGIVSDQAESIKELSQKPFGNSFFITGSTITNLTGSGNIEYTEAAHQVREMVIHGSDLDQLAPIVNQFARQLKQQAVATQKAEQLDLIQQLIVAEAEADPEFRAYLLKESQQILQAMAGTPLTQVIQEAIQALLPQQ